MRLVPFEMERWQSTYENRVELNLSESGVHPMTVAELLELADSDLRVEEILLSYGQSNGSDLLRERVAALHPGAGDDGVLVTVGGAEANLASFWHLLEPGEPVAVMLPNYMQVPGLVESFGGAPIPFHLREEDGWQPDLDELRRALERGARWILVTNPNNPTGAVLEEDAMEGILREADRAGAWILADEVYRGAELEGPETPSFWGRSPRVLVTNSLSKAYGLPGLRLGWVVGPPQVVQVLWARTDYTTIGVTAVSDALATLALEPGTRARILRRTRRILTDNLATLSHWMDAQDGLFRYRPPQAGAICWVRYQAPVGSSELAERLRVEKDLLVVPGDHFGMDRYLRIGYGLPEAELVEALDRIEAVFREVRGP